MHTKFYAETDHEPLVGYMKLDDPYGKIARWAAELQQFNFSIKYIKGETNIPADIYIVPEKKLLFSSLFLVVRSKKLIN